MSKNREIVWLISSLVALGVLTNAIIITTAYIYDPNLFWLLFISMPLLIVAIYNAKQTNHLLDRYRTISLQAAEKQIKYEWLSHSIYPDRIEENDLKVMIGNDQCSQPYNACIFNIHSLRDTHVKKSHVQAIVDKKPDYSKSLYEERRRSYYMAGDDLVWQIGPSFIGCRTVNGSFDSKVFKGSACLPEVKMIELILSTAIKPVYNTDSSLNIGGALSTKTNTTNFPGTSYSTFSEPEGMIHFLDFLRELSGGKPIGIRLCIGDKKEFHEICHAIRKTQLIPDFIVVEGSFESHITAHVPKGIHTVMPLYDALLFVSKTLEFYALEKKIKIIAYGRIVSCFDILKVLALGANAVCTEMPGYNTIERKTASLYKGQNVNDFYGNLINATIQVMKICGFKNAGDITLSKLFRRLDILNSSGFENLNGHISYPGTVKKLYTEKIKSYQSPEERKEVQYRRL